MQSRARNRTRVPVLIVAVLCAVPLSAGKKSRPTYTYDQTGVISFASFADSSVTINTDSGSYSAYCTFTGSHADCGEGVGAAYFIKLSNGAESALGDVPFDPNSYQFGAGYYPSPQDPIRDVMASRSDPHAVHEVHFRFWKDRYGTSNICLPIDPSRPYPNKPLKHQTEACYLVSFGPPDAPESAKPRTLTPDANHGGQGLNVQTLIVNSEAGRSSPAAAAALADAGHMLTPEEMAALVAKGEASRCAVVTMPPGAEIEVDGNRAGVSPLAFVLIKHGDTQRVITIRMNGYKTVEKRIIPDGNTIPIGITLEKQ
jgi:hypothetical protein